MSGWRLELRLIVLTRLSTL